MYLETPTTLRLSASFRQRFEEWKEVTVWPHSGVFADGRRGSKSQAIGVSAEPLILL